MSSRPLRLVFMGSDPIALPLLDWLAGEGASVGTVVAVFTQPDRPSGRGQKTIANPIKLWALARGLPVCQPEKFREPDRLVLAGFEPDLALVMAYGHLLRQPVIDTPRLGTVNLHASLLPAYRGASPIQTAVACGERETGVSLMRIVLELDAGPVMDVERVPIGRRDTALEVEQAMARVCPALLARCLPRIADGSAVFEPQASGAATFCRRLTKDDGAVDFSLSAREVAARVNGLFPWPACTVEVAGVPVKLGCAEAAESADGAGAPGCVLGADGEGLRVACGTGVVRLLRLQRPGGKLLPAPDFLRGFPISPGTVLGSRPAPALLRS
jgi:methionyl-tRNA formyltransferase